MKVPPLLLLALLVAAVLLVRDATAGAAPSPLEEGTCPAGQACGCAVGSHVKAAAKPVFVLPEHEEKAPEAVPEWTSSFEAHTLAYDPEQATTIPAGKFWMGTKHPFFPQDGEGPLREVDVGEFAIDAHTVSNYAFAQFVRATGYQTDAERLGWSFVFHTRVPKETNEKTEQAVLGAEWWLPVQGASWKNPEGPLSNLDAIWEHPAVHVSWNDASKYCEWKGKRLPSEEEWEKAARGGLKQRKYPWGNEVNPKGEHYANIWQGAFPNENTAEDGYAWTCPVHAFPPNHFGLYNMVGNVWEWTTSNWTVDHTNFDEELKVMRGGSYLCHKSYCYRYRVEARTKNRQDDSTGNLGFRCAKDVPHSQ